METPESRADRLITQFVAEALGPVDSHHKLALRTKIWQAIEDVKQDMAIEAAVEDAPE